MGSRTSATTGTSSSSSKRSTENRKSPSRSAATPKRSPKQLPAPVTVPHEDNDSDGEEEEEEYEVETIVAHKKTKNGSLIFLLKWKNYPDSENTWESKGDLNCYELMEQYLRDHNLDPKGNPIKSATATTPSRKRPAIVSSTNESSTNKKSKTTNKSPSKSISPMSENKKPKLNDQLDEFPKDSVRKLDPDLPSWEDLLLIETIGLADDDGGHEPTPSDRDQLTVYGIDPDGNRLCELLKDIRLKAPQRLLDFLLDHLKFRP